MNRRTRGRSISLSPFNRILPRRYQDIRRLDTWQPVDFPIAAYPDRATVLATVTCSIETLAASGSLDEDTGHVIDSRIDAWLTDWNATADYDLHDKLRSLDTLTAASAEELRRRTDIALAADERANVAKTGLEVARERYFSEPHAID